MRRSSRRPAGLMTPARRGLTIGLVLTITLVAFEALAVITILPTIKDDLEGITLYGWVTSAFQLGLLVGIVVAGGQADRRGPGPPFVAGVLVFMAGLAIGGLAPSMLVLVLARGLQGLGAGAIPAVAYAAIGRSYPEALRPRGVAVLSTPWVVPGLIGPAVSALVAASVGWRWVFLGLLPLVAASGALAWPSLRRLGPPAQPMAQRGGVAGWAVGGFGIGLAYSPISLIVLGEAPPGQEGAASASLQLAETLGVALGAGLGGVLVAAGAAAGWLPRSGLAGAFALTAAVALGAAMLA